MTDHANNPDPIPKDDDTAWPEHDNAAPVDESGKKRTDDATIEENTLVLGSPD